MTVDEGFGSDLNSRLRAATKDSKKKRLMVYLAPALHDRLSEFCEARGVSMNQFAIISIETALDHASKGDQS